MLWRRGDPALPNNKIKPAPLPLPNPPGTQALRPQRLSLHGLVDRVLGAQKRVLPQLESPARTGADGSTAALRDGGKPGHAHPPPRAGCSHFARAPAPAARQGPQVRRPGAGAWPESVLGCAERAARRGSPVLTQCAAPRQTPCALRARGSASPGGRVQGAG